MTRPRSISLRDRMLVASMVLAAIVVSVFVALIFAVSAARNATEQEARSKNITTAALRLEKLVLDVQTSVRGYAITRNRAFLAPYNEAGRHLKDQRTTFVALTADQPMQFERAQELNRAIVAYIEDFADPVVQFSSREAARIATNSEGRLQAEEISRQFKQFIAAE